jgi:hypothetical protein
MFAEVITYRGAELQEDNHDESLRATAGFTTFVPAPGQIGPAPVN